MCRLPSGMELGERYLIMIGTHRDSFGVPDNDPIPMYIRALGIPFWSARKEFVSFCERVSAEHPKIARACVRISVRADMRAYVQAMTA